MLEVGCGAGYTARYLEGTYDAYVGLDYSAELIRYARERNAGPRRDFVCANLKDYRSSGRFDVVLMVGVLHHIPDPTTALRQLGELLAPGGVVVVNEPQQGNPAISGLRWLRKRVDPSYSPDQVEFSSAELHALFAAAGYTSEGFAQGLLSTPFAETHLLPEPVARPLSGLATKLDPRLERWADALHAGRLAWNVVVMGRRRDG